MRHTSLFFVVMALSSQIAKAVPVPIDELAPVSDALKSAATALGDTTKGLSTGMAGGMGGVAGGMPAIPKIPKRQFGNKALDLSVAGVKPEELMKVVKDPTSALNNLPVPVEGLTKRVLDALTGLLGGLMPKQKPAPSAAPPVTPRPPQAKEKGTDTSVNIDNAQNSSEASTDIPGLEEALEGTSPGRNGTNSVTTSNVPQTPKTTQSEPKPVNSPESQTFSSPNTNVNSRSGETPSEEDDTQLAANERLLRRVLENLMPNSQVNADGLKNPELVLKELGAADVLKKVIDAPDLTGMKAKRSPLDPLSQLDSVTQALDSAGTLLKAVPLSPAA